MIRKPLGLLNVNGYFDPLIRMMDRAVEEGFLRKEHRELLIEDTEEERLLEKMIRFRPSTAAKWIERLKEGKI
jgi:predicted Rossmann-fold nucleotide-binding protein